MAFGFQESLGFHGRHAAGSRGRDGLAVGAILHVSRMEYSGDICSSAAFRQDVTVGVGIDLTLEYRGVGDMSDGDEESVHFLLPNGAGFRVAQPHSADK